MATAIYAKSESCDEYLFCSNDDLSPEEVQELLKRELEDEYDYVDHYMVTVTKSDDR